MAGYRPITDVWMMSRGKAGYYGSFPAGFLERARFLLGVTIYDPVLHVCGGAVRDYQSGPMKGKGLGPNDCTLDLNPDLEPDFLMDARKMGTNPGDTFPFWTPVGTDKAQGIEIGTMDIDLDSDGPFSPTADRRPWAASLIDRPYTDADAEHYVPGAEGYPRDVNDLLRRSLSVTRIGGKVGIIDYIWPKPPKDIPTVLVAVIMVTVGWNNRPRVFTVYERLAHNPLEYNVTLQDEPDEAEPEDEDDEAPEDAGEAVDEPEDEEGDEDLEDEDEDADEAEEEPEDEVEEEPEPEPVPTPRKKAKKRRRSRPSLLDGFGS